LSAAGSARARGDELEELLSGEATPPADAALSASAAIDSEPVLLHGSTDAAGSDAAVYSERAAWHATPSTQAARRATDDHDSGRETPPTINAVPEPSAIILALAALVYFLLFGRRRPMV
jgi:hypothetical protein